MDKGTKITQQKQIINDWIKYFQANKLNHDDVELQEKVKQVIIFLLKSEIEELGYDISEFNINIVVDDNRPNLHGHYSHNIDVQNGELIKTGKPEYFFNLANLYHGLQKDDAQSRVSAIETMCHYIFHEVQHNKQVLMIETEVSSNETFMYARDYAIVADAGNRFYNANYDVISFEKDAEATAYKRMQELGISSDENGRNRKKEDGILSTTKYVMATEKKTDLEFAIEDRDSVVTKLLDEAICKRGNIDLLIAFPILQKEYNLDGSKKSADILIGNMQQELEEIDSTNQLLADEKRLAKKNIQHMYYELIYRAIEKAKPEELAKISEQFSQVQVSGIFSNMQAYFQGEMERKLGKTADMASSTGDWKKQQDTRDRLVKYYEHKKEVISQIEGRLFHKEYDNSTQKDDDVSLDLPETLPSDSKNDETWQKRLKLVRKIISLYDISEADYQYERRVHDEQFNEDAVRKIVKPIEIDGKSIRVLPIGVKNLISDKTFYYNEEKGENEMSSEYAPRAVRNMINLLKAADNLTIDGGENFLLEFIQTPDVEYILGEMINGDTKLIGQLQERAEEAKRDNSSGLCTHPKTKGELAKEAKILSVEKSEPANFKTRFQDDIKRAGIDIGDVYQMAETIEKDMQQDRSAGKDR